MVMQVVARVIEPVIALPRKKAAVAMPVPTMARINAYSAADAPLSSDTNVFTNFNMIYSP